MTTNRLHITSSWRLPPTDKQTRAITQLCIEQGIKEPLENRPSNRWEARKVMHDLRAMRKPKKGG